MFASLFLVVAVRLVDVQVFRSDRYVSYGEQQRIEPISLPAGRGALFDRNGNDLAISTPTQSAYADPRLVTRPAAAAEQLAPVLGRPVADVREALSSDSEFVYLARQVDDEVAERVRDLAIEGVSFLDEPQRFYPGGDLAASLLGQVDIDGNGVSGLEARYDDRLAGTPGELIREVGPNGNTIPAGRQQVDPAERGDDLVLTLDRVLQHETERILGEQMAATGSAGGIAVVSRPSTGEILSLANLERDPETGRPVSTGNNRAVTANYEPGSVNKAITMAAAVEEGVVTPETVLTVPDSLMVGGDPLTDSHDHPTEDMTAAEILAESSNVGTVMIAQQLGADRMDDYLRRFGFGEPTALGLPHEAGGLLVDADAWSGTDISAIPIGQGFSVTAMQMLFAYNTIANDGVYQEPSLVAATVDGDGEQQPVQRADGRRVLSPAGARQVRSMLAGVVSHGTGEAAAIPGYDVAGKTGTARQPVAGGVGYGDPGERHHTATFAGFLPAGDPELSIIVVMDQPERSHYASDVAAPAFAEIGREAARRMRVPPTAAVAGAPLSLDAARVRAAPATTTTTAPPDTAPPATPTTVARAPSTTSSSGSTTTGRSRSSEG